MTDVLHAALDATSPVQPIPTDPPAPALTPGIALCLSGGGYRAMLFHLGALTRLNGLGYLPRLKRVSSVSGGSITAGVLGLHWNQLEFDGGGVARNFADRVAAPLFRLAGVTIDVGAVLRGAVGPGSIADRVIDAYADHLFGKATLQDLPNDDEGPRFVINATNVQSGALWRFMKPYMRDWRVGEAPRPTVPLARAVAASSAFPPILSPVKLKLKESDYAPPARGEDLHRPPFLTDVVLTDGGVYDNLGLETAWKRFTTILVSDAGGKLAAEADPKADWPRHTYRVLSLIDNQVRSLRKRQVIGAFARGERSGTYWGIWTDIKDYGLDNALPCPADRTLALAAVDTRLAKIAPTLQKRLVNWGYAVCDAALRRHVDAALPPPAGFPYPREGIG